VRARTLLIVVAILVLAACTGAQVDGLDDWSVFLIWLTTPGGGSLVIGALMSAGYEYIPRLSELTPKWKRAAFLGACLAVPVIGAALGVWTDGWAPRWRDTFWPALLTGVTMFGSVTIAHTPRLPDAPGLE